MLKKINQIVSVVTITCTLLSCSPSRSFPAKYYEQNEQHLMTIEKLYSTIYPVKPLAAAFTDKEFNHISLEMKTDSLRYVYEFSLQDASMKDSLQKYGYDTTTVLQMISQMKLIKCTWINTLDYYVDRKKRILTFMSIRNKALKVPFSPEKYFILTFYEQPQYYDANGILLDKRNVRRIRRVNNETFHRITDKVCYTLSARFR